MSTILTIILGTVVFVVLGAIALGALATGVMLISIIVTVAWDMFAGLFLGKKPRWD